MVPEPSSSLHGKGMALCIEALLPVPYIYSAVQKGINSNSSFLKKIEQGNLIVTNAPYQDW